MKRILSVIWNIFKVLRAGHDKEVVIRLYDKSPYLSINWENLEMRDDDDIVLIIVRQQLVNAAGEDAALYDISTEMRSFLGGESSDVK